MRQLIRPAASALLVLGTCSIHAAQTLPWEDFYLKPTVYHQNRIDWPAGMGGGGPFGRVVIGRLMGELFSTAVVLKGGEPVVMQSPAIFTALSEVSFPGDAFLDLAILEGEEQDTLLCVGEPGLVEFEFTKGMGFSRALLGTSIWNKVPRLVVEQSDKTKPTIVLGITHDKWRIVTLQVETGTEGIVLLEDPALDFMLLDFFPGGELEIVALTVGGLHIYAFDGEFLDDIRLVHPGGAIAPMRSKGDDFDRVAWMVRNAGDTHYLLQHFDHLGFDNPLHLMIPPDEGLDPVDLELVGLLSGDWNGDGQLDLCIPHKSFQRATVLLNQGEPQHFSTVSAGGDYLLIDLSMTPNQPAPENGSIYAFDPTNATARSDIIAPQDNTSSVAILRDPAPLEQSTKTVTEDTDTADPNVGEESLPLGFFAADSYFNYDASTETATLDVMLENVPLSLLQNYEYLQVSEWEQADPTVSPPPLMPTGLRNELHLITNPDCPYQWLHLEFDLSDQDYPSVYWPDRRHVYLQLRFVTAGEADGNLRVITASHAIAAGLTIQADADDEDPLVFLESLAGSGSTIRLKEGVYPDAYFQEGDNEVGGIVVEDYLPMFPGNQPPTSPDPDTDDAWVLQTWVPIGVTPCSAAEDFAPPGDGDGDDQNTGWKPAPITSNGAR